MKHAATLHSAHYPTLTIAYRALKDSLNEISGNNPAQFRGRFSTPQHQHQFPHRSPSDASGIGRAFPRSPAKAKRLVSPAFRAPLTRRLCRPRQDRRALAFGCAWALPLRSSTFGATVKRARRAGSVLPSFEGSRQIRTRTRTPRRLRGLQFTHDCPIRQQIRRHVDRCAARAQRLHADRFEIVMRRVANFIARSGRLRVRGARPKRRHPGQYRRDRRDCLAGRTSDTPVFHCEIPPEAGKSPISAPDALRARRATRTARHRSPASRNNASTGAAPTAALAHASASTS